MHNDLLVGGALVLVLGIVAQWLAWRLKLPSILLLLIVGILAGPMALMATGHPLLDVEGLLGDLLFTVVSLSVAVILFEGGLSLRFSDIRGSERVIRNLVTLGALVTWIITGVAAHFILGLDVALSLLLGATLVVTGPTVIIPLLNQIRPAGRVSSILRWEGIIIDPIGAILAVLVFEEILVGNIEAGIVVAIVTLLQTALIGGVIGWFGAQMMIELYRRYWVPDSLQNAATLMFVLGAFAISNVLQAESGLLTVTVMGIVMANQKRFDVKHIVDFKESLQILLISSLFILLSARMKPSDLAEIGWQTLAFIAVIVFLERPFAVWLSTIGSGLTWRERLFIAWMAPRGIVAAAVSSIFALELTEIGYPEAERLVPYTLAVIIGTVAIYSLTAGTLARRLGLSQRNPQGLLIVGANYWARRIALAVYQAGYRVVIADTNPVNIEAARRDGLETYYGSILAEVARDEINLAGVGRLLALTPNVEVNALAAEHFAVTFGGQNVYELARPESRDSRIAMSSLLGGQCLFDSRATYEFMSIRFGRGARLEWWDVEDAEAVRARFDEAALLPLFVRKPGKRLLIWRCVEPIRLETGDSVLVLIDDAAYSTSQPNDRELLSVP